TARASAHGARAAAAEDSGWCSGYSSERRSSATCCPGRSPRLPERPPPWSRSPRGPGRIRTYRSTPADSRRRPDRRRPVRVDLRPPPRRQRPATPLPGRPRGGPWRELEARDPGASLSLFARPPRVDRLPRLRGSIRARPCEVPPLSTAERPPQEVRSSGLKPNQTHDPTTIHRDTPPCPKHGPCSPFSLRERRPRDRCPHG